MRKEQTEDTEDTTDKTDKEDDKAGSDGDVVEITWMFWDDLEATQDLITRGYADIIDRFNGKSIKMD